MLKTLFFLKYTSASGVVGPFVRERPSGSRLQPVRLDRQVERLVEAPVEQDRPALSGCPTHHGRSLAHPPERVCSNRSLIPSPSRSPGPVHVPTGSRDLGIRAASTL